MGGIDIDEDNHSGQEDGHVEGGEVSMNVVGHNKKNRQ
jgi:hypothetical protein